MALILSLGLFILALIALILSASFTINFISKFSDKIKISAFFVASLLLALGTALPEISSSIIAHLNNFSNLGIGIILGSTIINLCLILSLVFLITKKQEKIVASEINSLFFLLGVLILFFIFAFIGLLPRWGGILFLSLFVLFHISNYLSTKKEKKSSISFSLPIFIYFVLILFGVCGIILSAKLIVGYSEIIAVGFGIPVALIGLLIIPAFGTSVPELASSIAAAIKKRREIAIGNIIGSNVTNVLFTMGVLAIISPVILPLKVFIIPLLISIFATGTTAIYVYKFKVFDRRLSVILLLFYVVFLISVII